MREPYPTDVNDQEWTLIQAVIPSGKPGGRPREVDVREVVNTLFYQTSDTSPEWIKGFYLLPKHWVVERTFAWQNNYRRLSKDYEYTTSSREARIKMANIQMLLKRLSKKKHISNSATIDMGNAA
jgi:transposase